jgi:hypothetical protein
MSGKTARNTVLRYLSFFYSYQGFKVEPTSFGYCEHGLIYLSYFIGTMMFPIFLIMSLKVVKEYERAVIMRLGRINGGARGI